MGKLIVEDHRISKRKLYLFETEQLVKHFQLMTHDLFEEKRFKLQKRQFLYVHIGGPFNPNAFIQDGSIVKFEYEHTFSEKFYDLWKYNVTQEDGFQLDYFALVHKNLEQSLYIYQRLNEEFRLPHRVWFSFMEANCGFSWHTDPVKKVFHKTLVEEGGGPSIEYENFQLFTKIGEEYIIDASEKHRVPHTHGTRLHLVAPIE